MKEYSIIEGLKNSEFHSALATVFSELEVMKKDADSEAEYCKRESNEYFRECRARAIIISHLIRDLEDYDFLTALHD